MSKPLLILLFVFTFLISYAQEGSFPSVPERITFIDENGFYKLAGASAISFLISEILMNEENKNFYQVRGGFFQSNSGYSIFNQQIGVEKKLAHWFSIGLEFNSQQWSQNSTGAGLGINTNYRWYAFGKKRLSPFIEYGAGVFYGFSPFPSDGTKFTFHLSSNLGLEYTLKNRNLVRFTYGHLHQSNNELIEPNPGVDATGLTLSYSWFWR